MHCVPCIFQRWAIVVTNVFLSKSKTTPLLASLQWIRPLLIRFSCSTLRSSKCTDDVSRSHMSSISLGWWNANSMLDVIVLLWKSTFGFHCLNFPYLKQVCVIIQTQGVRGGRDSTAHWESSQLIFFHLRSLNKQSQQDRDGGTNLCCETKGRKEKWK